MRAHRVLKWSIVASAAAVGLLIAIWIWRSESGVGLLLGALTYFAVLPVVRAPKWSVVVVSAAVGLVIAIWLFQESHGPGTDSVDGAGGLGFILGAPVSFVSYVAFDLLHSVGIEPPPGDFEVALWLAAVPLNWALLAAVLAGVLDRKPAAPSGPPKTTT